jgi:phosphatidylglycerol:prolipoprotein diacylglycerol transferase
MSKTRRSPARKHPEVNASPRIDVVQSDTPARTSGGFTALMESAAQQILAVTYWFDPAPHAGSSPVTVRFTGRRIDVKGRMQAGDKFVQDETIEHVVPGSGPISLTTRVRNINPGEWAMTAQVQSAVHPAQGPQEQENATTARPPGPIARLWRKWAPSVKSDEHMRTCLTPLARVPGILPGIWGAMVALGMAVALTLQSLVIASDRLAVGSWWVVTLVGIVVGIAGAKVWYVVVYRREHRINGWCIQGFITGATLTAAILLVALKVPAGTFLDATTPGLLVAMAVGRVGCFFAGCCGGPPTASRWGVWSSDQHVGARRIPTQLLELALALSLGMGVLVTVLSHGPAGGAFFVGGLAAYVLGRQGILQLRTEPRKTRLGGLVTATLAALVLIAAVVFLVR